MALFPDRRGRAFVQGGFTSQHRHRRRCHACFFHRATYVISKNLGGVGCPRRAFVGPTLVFVVLMDADPVNVSLKQAGKAVLGSE